MKDIREANVDKVIKMKVKVMNMLELILSIRDVRGEDEPKLMNCKTGETLKPESRLVLKYSVRVGGPYLMLP